VTDTSQSPERTGGHYETEVVYEVVENSGRRRILAAVLVLLVLLLVAVSVFVWSASRPAGAPESSGDDGMQWIRSIYAWGSTPAELLKAPVDAAIAPNGTIWTVSSKTTLVGFDPDGTLERLVPFPRGEEEGEVLSIEGMDVGEDGNIYLCDFGGNAVHVVSPQGEMLLTIGIQLPSEIAVRGDRMAVATVNGIAVLTTEGELIAQWATRGNGADQVDIPHGIAWADDETIVVADTHNRRVKAYSPDGRLLYIWPEAMTVAPDAGVQSGMESLEDSGTTPFQLPAGMTVDSAGRVLMVDPFVFAIMSIDPGTGELVESWGDFGSADGTFAYPTGIDYDPDRDYFVVADTANNRLQIVELPGSGGTLLAGTRRALDGPVWLCSIPLVLLALAVILYLSRRAKRRRERAAKAGA
jgi:sugar lactone lactonase YvrE